MNYDYGNQYSTTSYGAQGGAGGGGFITGDASQQSPGGSASRDHQRGTMRPVTIKQLINAQSLNDSTFKIDGAEVKQITFVGQVRNVTSAATHYTYRLDDGTGTIEVKQWIGLDVNAMDTDSSRPRVAENSYARVFGTLKSFNNKRHVGAHIVRQITDYNEIFYHLLEATVVHLHFTRGSLESVKSGAGEATAQNQYGNQQQGSYAGQQNMGAQGSVEGPPPGSSAAARRVYGCLKTTPQTNEGLNVHDISMRLGMITSEVLKAADELINYGSIWTTVDDETWAIMEV